MTLHLHIKYLLIAVLSLMLVALFMVLDAKHQTLKHSTSIHVKVVKQTVAPTKHDTPVLAPLPPVHAVIPVAHKVGPDQELAPLIAHNQDKLIDSWVKSDPQLHIPNGYVVEQLCLLHARVIADRSVTHPNSPRIIVSTNDHSVLAVCYKAP